MDKDLLGNIYYTTKEEWKNEIMNTEKEITNLDTTELILTMCFQFLFSNL